MAGGLLEEQEMKKETNKPKRPRRADQQGAKRTPFEKNRKRIYATQSVCALCGKPVDFSLKFPDPMSATVDHIIPIARGGSPDNIDNLQLAHLCCNRSKGDSLPHKKRDKKDEVITNRNLPQHFNWTDF